MSLPRWLTQSHAVGLALALGMVLALTAWLFADAERDQRTRFEQRQVLVEANALADILARAAPEAVAGLMNDWRAREPGHESAILVGGMELLGSTRPEDGAPRRLVREEKPLFDLANQIRSARETNLGEEVVRKKLVQFEAQPGGAYLVTVPYLAQGEFAGILQVRMQPAPPASPSAGLGALPLWLIALVAGLFLRSRQESGIDLGKLGAVALFIGLALFHQHQRMQAFEAADQAATAQVAEAVRQASAHFGAQAAGSASPWDTDAYLRPLNVVQGDGQIVEAERIRRLDEQTRLFQRSLWAVTGLGLAVLLLFLFGFVRRGVQTLRQHADAYAYVAPAMVGMLVLVFFPFLYGITLAFTDTTLFNESLPFSERWIGLDNFAAILGDFNLYERGPDGLIWNYQNFYWTLMVTVIWTITNVAIGVSLGFILAMVLNTEDLRGRAIYRVLLILPWAIPNYITALVWRGMFHPQFGVINQFLQMIGMAPVAWFDGVVSSFMTGLVTNGWLSFPFMMVVILGALQSIPKDMYEAAEVEGASRWQRLRHITLPLLKPTLIPAIVLSVVWTFNMFNIIFLVSGGEPAGANEILITKAYKIAFENYQYAYAAAYSTVIFIILLVYGFFQTRITKATESF
ncbi:MAG: carbohydrate ABC transporter permease [Pseudomonadota bacterium]